MTELLREVGQVSLSNLCRGLIRFGTIWPEYGPDDNGRSLYITG